MAYMAKVTLKLICVVLVVLGIVYAFQNNDLAFQVADMGKNAEIEKIIKQIEVAPPDEQLALHQQIWAIQAERSEVWNARYSGE